jgi:hypothetical protein
MACFAGPMREANLCLLLKIVLASSLTCPCKARPIANMTAALREPELNNSTCFAKLVKNASWLHQLLPGPTIAIAADSTHQANHQAKASPKRDRVRSQAKNFPLPCPNPFYSTKTKAITQPTKAITLARSSSQLSNLELLLAKSLPSQQSLSKRKTELC